MSDPIRPYSKRTEGLIRPAEVALISLFGSLLGRLPLRMQAAIMESSTRSNPTMGFVVEPYALFLCHEIVDLDRAQALIPDDYRIVPSRVFADDEPRPCLIFGAFTAHTSAFWGSRIEMYIIAERRETGMLSWLIVDVDTNTLSFDPGQGFQDANTAHAVVTTTHRGDVLVDVQSATSGRRIAVAASARQGVETPLDQRLWLEGNLSIGYGGAHSDVPGAPPFGLLFDPGEMERALRIPREYVELEELTWHEGLFDPEPFTVACFPYAQHFITSQIPTASAVRDRAGLDRFVAQLNQGPAPEGFSGSAIRRSMAVGLLLSAITTWLLVGWAIVHMATRH